MAGFQVDPKVGSAVTFAAGVVMFLGTNALPDSVPAVDAKMIHDWATYFGQLYLIVIGPALGLFSSSTPGPLAPPDPPSVVAAAAAAKAGK